MASARRQALIVLGMHRSGTSALGGALARLGASAPRSLMPPTGANPRGYYESVALMGLHDQILASSGSSWNDWDRFDQAWFDSTTADRFRERLAEVLAQEYDDARLLLIKDPRICRLLPFWLRALDGLGIVPRIVVSLRHPQEVAQSLHARDQFGLARGQLLWLRHVLDAESASRSVQRCFVRYADLLEDWRREAARMSRQLGIKWPRRPSEAGPEIDAFLGSELRHAVVRPDAPDGDGELAAWVSQARLAIGQLIAGDGDEAAPRAALDRIRAEFDRTAAIYGPVVREQVALVESETAAVRQQHESANRQLAEVGARAEAAERERVATLEQASIGNARMAEALLAQAGSHNQALAALQAQLATQTAELERRHVKEAELLKALEVSAQRVHEGDTQARQLQQELAAHVAEAGRRQGVETQLRGELEAMVARVHEGDTAAARLGARIHSLETEVLQHQQEQETRFTELASVTRRLLAQEAATERMRHEHAAETVQLQAVLASKDQALAQLELGLSAVHASRSWRWTAPLRALSGAFQRPTASTREDGDAIAAAVSALRASGRFDEPWYLEHYPDVRASGIDPALHYLRYGAAEGRDPSPGFSTEEYRASHPELAVSGANPLLHALRHDGAANGQGGVAP